MDNEALILGSIVAVFLLLLGLVMGSFASVLIARVRSGKTGIWTGRSACPVCDHTLAWYELIPLVSFVIQRGKCRHCAAPISVVYPFLEVLTGLLFLSVGMHFGMEGQWWTVAYLCAVFFTLVLISVYDLLYMEIPDWFSVPPIVLTLVTVGVWGYPVGLVDGLWGAGGITVFFGIQLLLGKLWGKEVLGLGDLRVGVLMGLMLGWQLSIVAMMISYIVGSVIGGILMLQSKTTWQGAVPFGPFLIIGLLVALFFGEGIWAWYWGMV